jgi:hypothetical protein
MTRKAKAKVKKIHVLKAVIFPNFWSSKPWIRIRIQSRSGSGSALKNNAGSGSALKPMRIRNTGFKYHIVTLIHFLNCFLVPVSASLF